MTQPEPDAQLPEPEPDAQLPEPDAQLPEPETDRLPEPETDRLPEPETDRLPESETDRLAGAVDGAQDTLGMATLWRVTMGLPHWWFLAAGDPGDESPAAAEMDDKSVLLTFTSDERARHFAVEQGLLDPEDTLRVLALPPEQVVAGADELAAAGLDGLMLDPHLSGYYMPADQLAVVWQAVHPSAPTAPDDSA